MRSRKPTLLAPTPSVAAPAPTASDAAPTRTPSVAALALAGIVVAGTLVRGLTAYGHAGPAYFPDEYLYSELSRSLAENGHAYVRGNPSHFLPLLAPLVMAPAWFLDHVSDAYRAVQWINAFSMSLGAVPVYLLGRFVGIGRRLALVASALALLLPALLYSSFVLSEPVAYPLVLSAVAAGVWAIERPSARTIATFLVFTLLATFTRLQFAILLPCFLVAVGTVLAHERRLKATLRRQWPSAALLLLATAALAIAGPGRRTGYYASFLDVGLNAGTVLSSLARNAYVMLFEGGFVLVPGAILGLAAALWRPRTRAELVFAVFTVIATLAVLLQASIYGDTDIAQTRYAFYVLPLWVLAFLVYVERAWPWRRVHAVLGVALIAVAFITPLATLAEGRGKVHSPVLFAVGRLEQSAGSAGTASVIVLLTVVAAMALVVAATLRPRVAAVAALAIAGALTLVASIGAWSFDARNTHLLRDRFVGAHPSWVDDLHVGSTPIVLTPNGLRTDTLEQMFWNRSLDRMVLLPAARPTDVLPTIPARVGRDGTILVDGQPLVGTALIDEYASSVQLQGAEPLGSGPTSTLYRSEGPLRIRLLTIGRYSDGWLANRGVIAVWPDTARRRVAGRIVFSFTPPPGKGTVTLRFRGPGTKSDVPTANGAARRVAVAVCANSAVTISFEGPPAGLADGRIVAGRATRPVFVPDAGACPP